MPGANETIAMGRMLGFEVSTTPAYSPESNGMAEAFVKTFKREYGSGRESDDPTICQATKEHNR